MSTSAAPAESALLDAARRGAPEARQRLFELYREVAFRVALRITGRHEDALDVTQDAFIKVFETLDQFRGGASFKTWLLRIVSNRALDVLRARRVRLATSLNGDPEADGSPRPPDARGEASPGQALERREMQQQIAAAVEALPADQRAVFALFAGADLSYAEIAEALGIPIGTVMSRLYHARGRLKAALADLAPHGTEGTQ